MQKFRQRLGFFEHVGNDSLLAEQRRKHLVVEDITDSSGQSARCPSSGRTPIQPS